MCERKLNSKINHEDFSRHLTKLRSRPRMLFLELTRSCNLACPMCRPQILAGKHLTMSDSVLDRVEDELFPYVKVVDMRGWGESTLDRRLFSLIDQLNSSGIHTKLFTNLSTRNEQFWREMGQKNISIAVSIEAATPDVYERFRKGAKFTRFLSNLNALRREQLKRNGSNDIYFSTVISDENLCEILHLIYLAAEYDVPIVRLNPITLSNNISRYPLIGVSRERENDLRQAIIASQKLAQCTGVRLELAANLICSNLKHGGFDLCSHPWSYVYIRYDGGVGFCDHLMTNDDSILGNILDSPFMEIWNNDHYQQLRREHLEHDFDRLHNLGIECDWCYINRYADCENMIEPEIQPFDISNFPSF